MITNEKAPNVPGTRRLTICKKSFPREGGYAAFPIISLSGKWLEDAGFKSGQVIDIAYEDCKLTITLSSQQRFAHVVK